MLDLRSKGSAAPWHWRQAPLLDAPLCLARHDGLYRLGHHQPVAASPALLGALSTAGANGEMLIAEDSSGTVWRLRRAGAGDGVHCWQLQYLHESRSRLLGRLRGLLAPRLSACVLHELRNPLNALTLHADLIARLLPEAGRPAPTDRLAASVDIIKQRLRELSERQYSAVALWLEDAAASGSPPLTVSRLVDASLRLIRGYMSLQDVRLRSASLQLPADLHLRGHLAAVQLALLAALLVACAGAKRNRTANGGADVVLLADKVDGSLVLELQSALDGETLARELADTDGAGLFAALALLLEPAGISLDAQPEQALLRLAFPLP